MCVCACVYGVSVSRSRAVVQLCGNISQRAGRCVRAAASVSLVPSLSLCVQARARGCEFAAVAGCARVCDRGRLL